MTVQGRPDVLQKVVDGRLCSGCGACAALAPEVVTMDLSTDGYLRPKRSKPLSEAQGAAISSVCPGLGMSLQADDRFDHVLWGPYLSVSSGYAEDPDLRHNASSGGILSALLVHLLDSGEVDCVLQIAADPKRPIGNQTVFSNSADDVFQSAGSRYAPSAPLAEIGTLLDGNMRYAFVGKPCDVAALRTMGRSDPRVGARFPYMLSFFCAGVPSLKGANEILSEMGVSENELAQFRYRGDGWPGYATAIKKEGGTTRMSYAESWGGILSRHVQFRCKICPDGTGSFADVVCADAWEADEKGYPVFSEAEGVSLVMGRTKRGEALIENAKAAGRIKTQPFDIDGLAAIQPGQTQKRRFVLSRLLALRMTGRVVPCYHGFHLWQNARKARLGRNLKNLLGTLRRIARGRL
ncbi:MAG: Coenzyme F420 hydrogenase/dehydrogenase, beta subunit C-terminal domain [Paracoccaceae bacterium]